jgi:diguanylate cyclase (GGDEF)-like protein
LDARRRLIYLSGIAAGFPVIIIVWLAERTSDPYVALAYPLLALFLVAAGLVLLRRPATLQGIESATLLLVGTLFLSRMTYVLTTVPPLETAWPYLGPMVYMNLVLLIVFANMVLQPLRALHASFTIIGISALIGLARFIPEVITGVGSSGLLALLRYEVYLLIISGFMYALAKSKDDYFEARLETKRMEVVAHTDALTGLPNRMLLDRELRRSLDVADRHGRPLSLIAFDLDRFKNINDRYGHAAGDEILQEVAALTIPLLRGSDLLGRWGGEEFLIIAPETGAEQARTLAERIRATFEQHRFPHGISVTASFGVAASADDGSEELYKRADALLYTAKRGGRNRVV